MTVVDKLIGSAPFVCEGDPVSGIEAAARLGYDGVELHFTDPLAANAEEIRTALRRTGLGVTALGTGRAYVNDRLSITDADEAGRLAAVRRLEQFIALAGQFGAKVIIGCMRGNLSKPEELPAAAREYISFIEKEIGCPIKYVSVGAEREAYIKMF